MASFDHLFQKIKWKHSFDQPQLGFSFLLKLMSVDLFTCWDGNRAVSEEGTNTYLGILHLTSRRYQSYISPLCDVT